jgi:hypothetical protein
LLTSGASSAASFGVPWTGITVRRLDEAGEFSNSGILSLYQRQACAADAIVTGHSSISMSHMSEFQTSVDSDNDFAIDSVIKGNSTAAIRGRSDIVMTSVGGAAVAARRTSYLRS